jgi:hypothetical protein
VRYLKIYLLLGTEAGWYLKICHACRYLKVCLLVGTEAGAVPLKVCLLVGTEAGAVPEGVAACRYRIWCGT